MAFVVNIWQAYTLPPYLFLLNPNEMLYEGKHNTNLVQKQLISGTTEAYDHLSELAFYIVGPTEEAVAKSEKLAEEYGPWGAL